LSSFTAVLTNPLERLVGAFIRASAERLDRETVYATAILDISSLHPIAASLLRFILYHSLDQNHNQRDSGAQDQYDLN